MLPYAVFRRRETALLAAAVLAATGREPLYRLATDPDGDGFPLLASPAARPVARARIVPRPALAAAVDAAGHLRDFDEDLAVALHLAAALVRSPTALARLLEAAGHVALEQAGRILDRSIH